MFEMSMKQTAAIKDIVTNTSPDDEATGNGGKRRRQTTNRVGRNMKAIIKKAREDIRKYNKEILRETIMTSKSLKKVKRTQKLVQLQTDHIPRQVGKGKRNPRSI